MKPLLLFDKEKGANYSRMQIIYEERLWQALGRPCSDKTAFR
jgi:hypothetical protein